MHAKSVRIHYFPGHASCTLGKEGNGGILKDVLAAVHEKYSHDFSSAS
jgi:hypothetical protein